MRARIAGHLSSAVPGFAALPSAVAPPPPAPPVRRASSAPISIGRGQADCCARGDVRGGGAHGGGRRSPGAYGGASACRVRVRLRIRPRVRPSHPRPRSPPRPRPRSPPRPRPRPRPRRRRRPFPDRKSDLARERSLIDAARSGVAHGNPNRRARRRSPSCRSLPERQLSEERDALRILALAGRGVVTKRHAYDRAFRARYPQSLLRRRSTLRSEPRHEHSPFRHRSSRGARSASRRLLPALPAPRASRESSITSRTNRKTRRYRRGPSTARSPTARPPRRWPARSTTRAQARRSW